MKGACVAAIALFLLAVPAWPQSAKPKKETSAPAPVAMPYANMPKATVPYGRFRKPYYDWYVRPDTMEYDGAARSEPDPPLSSLRAIKIGFLGPLDATNPDSQYGIPMLDGAQLAIADANADGGYHGKPFALEIHNDLPLWGASSMEIVRMRFDQHVWGMLGSVDAASTHIELRATLKIELPIVNTATNDPTETETRVQWLLHNFPDDRQQGYALADYIFNQLKLRHIGILRTTNRYGRKGTEEFFNAARRMGFQPVVMVKYSPDATDYSLQLATLKPLGLDGLVIWGDAEEAGRIVKQMRARGMQQPVFGSSRVVYPELLRIAGPAANGLVAVAAMDPDRSNPRWQAFRRQYLGRFHTEPDAYASYAYDGMNLLIRAIRQAGLNRARIMDALRGYEMKRYEGVSGTAFFDYTLNNIAPVTFAKVKDGHFVYWPERRTDWKGKEPAFMK